MKNRRFIIAAAVYGLGIVASYVTGQVVLKHERNSYRRVGVSEEAGTQLLLVAGSLTWPIAGPGVLLVNR